MSTGLVIPNDTGVSVIDPDTGEVTPLEDTPTLVIARVLGLIQHTLESTQNAMYEAKRELGREIIARMDRAGEWTVTARGVKIVAPSPEAGTVSWDAEALDEILEALVAEGVLDQEARLRVVKREWTLTVDKRAVNALLKIPAVKSRIGSARRSEPAAQRKASVRIDPRNL